MRGRAVSSSSSASHQRVAIVISNSRTCIRGIGSCRDDGLEASATSDTVVGRRQGFESEPSALPSEACSSVGQSLSVLSTSVDDSRFPNPESSAVTAFLHSRNDSVISNQSRSPADQPSEEFALRRRRVCVIAGLRVSGMPASTGRREQSVCFFAGKRGPASECRVSSAGAGRAAARQNRGAHLYACGADSLLVLRHSQRPDGDARRRLLRVALR